MKEIKEIHVHFICTGNAYRSRLAEAYLSSKQIPGLEVSSSGLEADKYRELNGPITWYGLYLLARYGLLPYLSKPTSTQTEADNLTQADKVIFMSENHHRLAVENFRFDGDYEIWNIPDINDLGLSGDLTEDGMDLRIITAAKATFDQIRQQVDTFISNLLKLNK